jgi:hypothetical protein
MNIFARELVLVLGAHGKELSNLFGLKVEDDYTGIERRILPSKVTRLKRSLSEDLTATLNVEELEALESWAQLTPTEMRRLHAALVAEAVRALLAGRMMQRQASDLADLTMALLLGQDSAKMQTLRDQILDNDRGVRGDDALAPRVTRGISEETPLSGPPEDDRITQALDPAMDAFEHGTLWLEVARDTSDRSARAGYIALARALLTRARELTTNVSGIAQGAPEQADLLVAVDEAERDADMLR